MEEGREVRRRRRHSAEFKAQVLEECKQPGESIAGVALRHGLNLNLVHKWRRESHGAATLCAPTAPAAQREFIALPLATPAPISSAAPDIRIEIARAGAAISVHWPLSAASDCAAWLKEWLR